MDQQLSIFNATQSQPAYVTWEPEPTRRGTFNILSTCITTLAFCVWSSVHIDVVDNKRNAFLQKLLWLFVGLLAPEILLIMAYSQRRLASKLMTEANEHFHFSEPKRPRDQESRSWERLKERAQTRNNKLHDSESDIAPLLPKIADHSRTHRWTLTHGFYAAMGGYAFDASVKPKFLPGSCTRAILTPKGVEWLMVHNPTLLPELSKEMIMDKSKADGLAKLILLVQSCWFCVNCLTRMAQRLPLSLLEVTTVAHALCTLITYLLWWHKPLNICQSTLIFGENARETCALMWMTSPSKLYCFAGMLQSKGASELSSLASSALLVQDTIRTEPNSAPRLQRILETASKAWHDPRWNGCSDTSLSSQTTIERWKLASRALSDYDPEHWYSWGQLVTPQAELRGDLHAQDIFSIQAIAAVAVLTAVYGAPHLAVWDAEFPTHLEQALWRFAAVVMTTAGLTGMISVKGSFMSLAAIIFPLYVFSSTYIVVESFRQLFHLPPEAYQLPQWSNYFPHIS